MKTILASIFFFSLFPHAYGVGFELKPGLWRLESELHSKSFNTSNPQGNSVEMCITKEESRIESSLIKDGDCQFKNIHESHHSLSGEIFCSEGRRGKAHWKRISDNEFIMTMESNSTTGPIRFMQRGYFIKNTCQKS